MIEAIKEWEKINEQQREYIKVIKGDIESLKESYKIAHEYNEVADKEIERLQNIIKEVREYIEKHIEDKKYLNNVYSDKSMLEIILDILD